MSLNILPLDLVQETVKEFDLKEKRVFSVLNGPQEFTCRKYVAQSMSSSGFNITCDPPSENDLIYPVFWKKCTFNVAMTVRQDTGEGVYGFTNGSTAAIAVGARHLVAPRAFPLSKITASESVSLNGAQFTTNLNDYENAFMRFCNDTNDRTGKYSMCPSMLDEMHNYGVATATTTATGPLSGLTAKDPFAKYGDQQIGESRAAFIGCDYSASDAIVVATGAVDVALNWQFTTMEPCFISPFWYQDKALTQIKSLSYSCNFGDITRAVAVAGITPYGGATRANANNLIKMSAVPIGIVPAGISLVSAELHFYYATPKLLDRIPKQLSYSYQEIQVFKQTIADNTGAGIAAGTTVPFSISPINLSSVPRRVIIWTEETTAQKNVATVVYPVLTKSDTLKGAITGINVSFGNRSGLLSAATQDDLYYLSKRNGLNMSYSQFAKHIGSAIALDFGRDIGLPTDMSVSVLSNPMFAVSGYFKNISDDAVIFDVKMAIIYDGVLSIINGTVNRQLGVLSQNDVLEAQLNAPEMISEDKCANLFGGRIGGSSGGFNPLMVLPLLKPIISMIRKGAQVGAPIVKGIADAAEGIGLGVLAGKIAGNRKPATRKRGGKVISRGDLSRGDLMGDYDEM